MSLDIWVTEKVETQVISKNITHNVSGMWKEAGIHEELYNSDGKKALEIIPALEAGFKLMAEDPERFKAFDASNGWGTYRHALPWLAELISELKNHPNGIITISK